MCLDRVTKIFVKPSSKEVIAYKIVKLRSNSFNMPKQGSKFVTWYRDADMPMGRWIVDQKCLPGHNKIYSTLGKVSYRKGFHVLLDRARAEEKARTMHQAVVVRVVVKGCVALGIEGVKHQAAAVGVFTHLKVVEVLSNEGATWQARN